MLVNPKLLANCPFWAAEIIAKRTNNFKPKLAIVLGSGLGKVSSKIENPITICYDDLPFFNISTIEGHNALLHLGMLQGYPVACFEGRTHLYEGQDAFDVIKNIIRTLKLLDCETLLTTCATGSLNKDIGPGELVLLKDHINFTGKNILIGPNDARFGERFISMDTVYDLNLRKKILAAAKKLNITLHEGVHIGVSGPTFETPAEIRAYKMLGANVIGMSNIPEVMVARHAGLKVASICTVVNLAAGLTDEVLSHEGTLQGAKIAVEKLANVLLEFVKEFRE